MATYKQCNLSLDPDLLEEWDELARDLGLSRAAMIKMAVEALAKATYKREG